MNIQLARRHILTLKPYQSARSLTSEKKGKIWLNANEYPTPPNYTSNYKLINRYPICQPKEIIEKYATYAGVHTNQVLVSRGADESIELLMKVFCDPIKDYIIFCPPTYGMYKTSAEILGIKYKMISKEKNWQLNIFNITSQLENVKLIYICHPNNPTGNIINLNSLKKLLDITRNQALLITDEAYIDFCPKASVVNWITTYPHLIVLRTLSKAFSLAGLRCGFTLANIEIIELLKKVIAPYPLPTPVIDIAAQALTYKGIQQTKNRITLIKKNRNLLITGLKQCPCVKKIFNSDTNYVLVKFNPNYKVFQKLLQKGIILRNQNEQPGLENCLRITVGTRYECTQLISVLKNLHIFPTIIC